MRYSFVSFGLSWQVPQVLGRLSLKTGESACLTGTMSCVPWQLVQEAASDAPIWWLTPWMLVAYCAAAFSWQVAHWAGGSFDGCGVSVMVTWQSTQLSFPWTDLAKTSGCTPIHSGAWPFLRGLNSASWQSMHSLFGTDCHEAEFKSRKKGLPKEWVGVRPRTVRRVRRHGNSNCIDCHVAIADTPHPTKLRRPSAPAATRRGRTSMRRASTA